MRYIRVKYYHIVILTAFMLVLSVCRVRAQYDVPFSHYFDMQTYFNPAAAGKEAKINVSGAYNMSMVGFENSPKTMYFAGDMPLRLGESRVGLGMVLLNDKIGLFSHQNLAAQVALRRQLLDGWLAVGAQVGLLSEKFTTSGLDLGENSVADYAFPQSDETGNAIDVGVGVYYSRGPWYVGLSAKHITYPTLMLGETAEMSISGSYYLTGGYTFKLRNPLLSLATSALVMSDLTGYRGDVSARLIYTYEGRKLYAGAGYSPTNSATIYLGGMFKGVMLGYSYELYTNGIKFRNGSHELHIGYQTDVNLGKKGKNLHKSVRYL